MHCSCRKSHMWLNECSDFTFSHGFGPVFVSGGLCWCRWSWSLPPACWHWWKIRMKTTHLNAFTLMVLGSDLCAYLHMLLLLLLQLLTPVIRLINAKIQVPLYFWQRRSPGELSTRWDAASQSLKISGWHVWRDFGKLESKKAAGRVGTSLQRSWCCFNHGCNITCTCGKSHKYLHLWQILICVLLSASRWRQTLFFLLSDGWRFSWKKHWTDSTSKLIPRSSTFNSCTSEMLTLHFYLCSSLHLLHCRRNHRRHIKGHFLLKSKHSAFSPVLSAHVRQAGVHTDRWSWIAKQNPVYL